MLVTQAISRGRGYRKVAAVPVTKTEVNDIARLFADYGDGKEWGGTQPSDLAYLRDAVQRGHSALPMRALKLLLWNGKAQPLADYINARRRAKLGRTTADSIAVLTLEETVVNERVNVLQMKEETVGLDSSERAELVRLLRVQAEKSTLLADAEADKLFADQVVRA